MADLLQIDHLRAGYGEAIVLPDLSLRLAACMNTLPLRQGMPVLEIGCGCRVKAKPRRAAR